MCKTVFVYSGLYTGSQHAPCWSDTLPRALACPNLSFKPIILAPKNAPPGTDEGDPLPAYPIEVQLNVLPSNLLSSLTLLSSPPRPLCKPNSLRRADQPCPHTLMQSCTHSNLSLYSGLHIGSQHAPCWSDTLPRALACPNLPFKPIILAPKNAPPGTSRGESIPHRHPIAAWYIPLKNCPKRYPPLHLIL